MKAIFHSIILGLLLPGFSLLSSAQPASPPGNRPARGIKSTGPGQALMSVLTPEQRASLRDAMMGQRDKLRDLEQKLRGARRQLYAAGLTAQVNEKLIRQKGAQIGKLEAEAAILRARAFAQIKPPLSAAQIEQLKKMMPAMRPLRGGPPPGAGFGGPPRGRAPQRDANDLPVPAKP